MDAGNPFRGLDRNCTLLGFETAKHTLPYIKGPIYGNVIHFEPDTKCSAKEKSLIGYPSGHVFGAFYRRIRFSKTTHHDQTYHQQCLSFLVARKFLYRPRWLMESKRKCYCFFESCRSLFLDINKETTVADELLECV